MSRMRHSTPLHLLGLVSSLWLVLAGCGGQSGSDGSGGGSTAPRVRHLTLQLTRAPEAGSPARPQGSASAQVRQVQPGDPAFLQRLDLRVQTPQGVDLLAPQEFPLGPAEQETVVLDVLVPDPPPAEFRLLVTAFNNFNNRQTAIFLGQVLIQRGQESATLTLVRNPDPATLILVGATPTSLQQTVFPFLDGAIFGFGLGGVPVTLTTGTFQGTTGTFTLAAGGGTAGGQLTLGSCEFLLTVSTFPPGQGPQVGDRITFDPCEVDAVDGRLTATNVRLNIRATSEAPGVAAPTPEAAVVLPLTTPTLVTDEDTLLTAQVEAALVGGRPGHLSFAITEGPAHGTAEVNATGLLTYQPAAQFHGSDHLMVTVTATFDDGILPLFVLGTLPVAITVQSLNDPPSLSNPGPQTTPENQAVSLALSASDPDGDALTYSATGLPPGLSVNATTGLITGTVAVGAASGSPYNVTATVSDTIAPPVSVSFTWTVAMLSVTVSLGSPATPVAPGATFTVPVSFATGGINVLSYLFQLSFNSSVVNVVNIVGLPPFEDVVSNNAAFASGLVKFAANNSTFTPMHGDFDVARIEFEVVGNVGMTSALQLDFTITPGGTSVLVNDVFQPIPSAAVTFAGGSVTVSGE